VDGLGDALVDVSGLADLRLFPDLAPGRLSAAAITRTHDLSGYRRPALYSPTSDMLICAEALTAWLAERRQPGGLGPAPPLLDPLRNQGLVGTRQPAQLGDGLPPRLILLAFASG
jgi:hypothetical protein